MIVQTVVLPDSTVTVPEGVPPPAYCGSTETESFSTCSFPYPTLAADKVKLAVGKAGYIVNKLPPLAETLLVSRKSASTL